MTSIEEIQSYIQQLMMHSDFNLQDIPGKLILLNSYVSFCTSSYSQTNNEQRRAILYNLHITLRHWIEFYSSF